MASSESKSVPLLSELESRGLIKQTTAPELAQALEKGPMTLYCGFDPTSDSLHVGSLLPLLTLKRFQNAGHRVIAVVGGATGMIGDPSGKSQERNLLDEAAIAKNLAGITRVIERFLNLSGPNPALIVNNGDWFKGMGFIQFLRDVGKHFTVNHMLAKESVRSRLEDREHGISYTEFSYMLLQAYDFYVLNKTQGCHLQVGGSDQWGNITAGVELIRRMHAFEREANAAGKRAEGAHESPETFGLTWPLLTKSDGTKFGKTESGALWLTADRTSAYQFHQYFLQTADTDVISLLKQLTFLPREEIAELEALTRSAPEKRVAQHRLADELTRIVHGETELQRALNASKALFNEDVRSLDATTLLSVFAGAPKFTTAKSRLTEGLPLIDTLAESGLCASKGAARKEIQGGGISINNERVSDIQAKLEHSHLIAGRFIVLRRGKKTHQLVEFHD
jgi:tyrosyl-tRNA synthetase